MKIRRSRSGRYWNVYFKGYMVGCWRTPKEARHKARMWWVYLTTGDEAYLTKEIVK